MDAVNRMASQTMREENQRAAELRRATLRTADAAEKAVALLTSISQRLERLERCLEQNQPPQPSPDESTQP